MQSQKIRAAFITDLHNVCWNDDPEELPEIIASEKPDIILCGGDMILARPDQDNRYGLFFMRRMMEISRVYFALGNHEYRSRIYPETYGTMYEEFIGTLKQEGLCVLDNNCADTDICGIPLKIFGLSLPREKYARFKNPALSTGEMIDLIGKPDPRKINILLAHNAKYYRTYLDWGADITLCGHYHGGIARFGRHTGLLSPGLRPFPGNAYGEFRKNGNTLVISSGLGEHTVPLRLNNPRELVMLEIKINNQMGGSDGDPCET